MSEPKKVSFQADIRRPYKDEFAIIFEEGGHIYTVPEVKIVFLPHGIIYDSILEEIVGNPWAFVEVKSRWRDRLARKLMNLALKIQQ